MHLGFHSFYRQYNRNRMFENASAEIGDDLNYPIVHLGQRLRDLGHTVATIDTAPLTSFDAVVFFDYPTKLNSSFRELVRKADKDLYLVMFESPAVRPDNWNRANHTPFKKVFTWNSAWVDNKKYFRLHLPNKLPEPTDYTPSTADKFCCTIVSHKYSWSPQEIYTERIRAIRWFEEHHPDEFDLYGQRWDRFFFRRKLSLLNPVLALLYQKCPWLPRHVNFPSHRGAVKSKRATLKQYKFSFCYENSVFPGYLTEKIFDALFAGCVPIYLGDPEVDQWIPPETFVNKKNFPDYEALYDFLKNMSASEYENYRKAIHKFVHGPAIYPFSAEAFADLIVQNILKS